MSYPVARIRFSLTSTAPTRRFIQLDRRDASDANVYSTLEAIKSDHNSFFTMKYASQLGRRCCGSRRLRFSRYASSSEESLKSLLIWTPTKSWIPRNEDKPDIPLLLLPKTNSSFSRKKHSSDVSFRLATCQAAACRQESCAPRLKSRIANK